MSRGNRFLKRGVVTTCMLLATGKKGNRVGCEPTVDELLAESIVRAMMAADGVSPPDLAKRLRGVIATRGEEHAAR